jgi:multidrug efflux pump subunit AcrA (membrane-fusion protein)
MRLSSRLLLALLAGVSLFSCQEHWATKSASVAAHPMTTQPALGALLGVGTVLTSHSFPLALYRHGPIKHLYVEGGQHVRKGELLLKYYDYTFLMAPAAGIITQFADTLRNRRSGAEPAFFFTAVTPFRLRMPASSSSDTLALGQQVQVQSTQHPTQVVTGVLVAIQPDSASLLLDLRLLSIGHEPLPAQAQVRVNRLRSLPKNAFQIGNNK